MKRSLHPIIIRKPSTGCESCTKAPRGIILSWALRTSDVDTAPVLYGVDFVRAFALYEVSHLPGFPLGKSAAYRQSQRTLAPPRGRGSFNNFPLIFVRPSACKTHSTNIHRYLLLILVNSSSVIAPLSSKSLASFIELRVSFVEE